MVTPLDEEIISVTVGDRSDTLDREDDQPVVLERDGIRYRIVREGPTVYDPERAREAMRNAPRRSKVDAEALIQHLYAAREEGSRTPSDA